MGLKSIKIIFCNGSDTYYTGSEISCQLILQLDAPKRVQEIAVKFKGKALVSWTELASRNMEFTATELYFKHKFNLTEELLLPEGQHNFEFSTILPDFLPSSYESDFGYIRYTVKAILRRPWKFSYKCKARFNVISPLNLNDIKRAKAPLWVEDQKLIGIPFCKSGLVSVSMMAPCSGFTPGQIIPLTIEIENGTNVDITDCFCILNKVTSYMAKHPHKLTKVVKTTIAQLSIGKVYANGSIMWDGDFPIPAIPPVNTKHCSIIDSTFEIKLKLAVTGIFNRDVNIVAPIVLGTEPILNKLCPNLQVKKIVPTSSRKSEERLHRSMGTLSKEPKTRSKDHGSKRRKYFDFPLTRSAPSFDTINERLIKSSDHAISICDVQF